MCLTALSLCPVSSRQLSLANNQLIGSIPLVWSGASSLASLDMSNNQLSGTIPLTFSTLTGLAYVCTRNTSSALRKASHVTLSHLSHDVSV